MRIRDRVSGKDVCQNRISAEHRRTPMLGPSTGVRIVRFTAAAAINKMSVYERF